MKINKEGYLVRMNRNFKTEEMPNGVNGKCMDISFTYGDTKEDAIRYILSDTSLKIVKGEGIENTRVKNIGIENIQEDPTKTNKHHCLVSNVLIKYLTGCLRCEDSAPE